MRAKHRRGGGREGAQERGAVWAEALAGAKVSRVYAGACVRVCVLEGVWALKRGERLEEGEEMLSGKSRGKNRG